MNEKRLRKIKENDAEVRVRALVEEMKLLSVEFLLLHLQRVEEAMKPSVPLKTNSKRRTSGTKPHEYVSVRMKK